MANHSKVMEADHNDEPFIGQAALKLIGIGAVCLIVFLTMQFPVLLDDWAWGGSVGIERLRSGFVDYGGRYVGYLISIFLARCAPARLVVMSGTVIAIAYMTYVLAGKKRIDTFFLSLAIIYCVPAIERAQTLAWTSGFTNYVIPVALFQVYLLITMSVFEDKYEKPAVPFVALVVLGFTNSLIMETVTLLNLVAPVVVCLICLIRFRILPSHQVAYWMGSLAGAIAMFTNSAYQMVFAGSDSYRSLSDEFLTSALEKIVDSYSYYLSSLNWAVIAPLLLLCLVSLFGSNAEGTDGVSHHPFLLSALALLFACALVFSIYCSFIAMGDPGYIRNSISVVIMSLVFCAMVVLLLLFCRHSWARLSLFVLFCIVVVVAPLVAVNPVSERCFFPGYALEMLVVCTLWDNLVKDETIQVSLLVAGILFAVLTSNLSIYHEIHEAEQERLHLFEWAIDEGWKDIKLMPYPNSSYVHVSEPESNYWKNIMKEYYGLPSDIKIRYKTLVPMVVPAQQAQAPSTKET